MSNDLYTIEARKIWKYLKGEDLPFWLINLYLFFEYVRPQTLYPVIDFLPYAQIILIATFISVLTSKQSFHVANIENKLLWLYFGAILFSSMFALSPGHSFSRIMDFDFITWILIYYLIINIVTTEKRFLVFILAFLIYNFKMSQHSFIGWAKQGFSFSSWGSGSGPGWFHNSGEFGIEMCVFFPIALYFVVSLWRHWPKWKIFLFLLFPLTAVSGMISSSSRGALLGGAAVVVWIVVLQSRYKIRALLVMSLVAYLVFLAIPLEQKERFQSSGEDRTSTTRLERWERGVEMGNRYPLFGVGYENWTIADKKFFGSTGGLSHNIFVQCFSELGYSGLVVFVLMILLVLINNFSTRKIARQQLKGNKFIESMAFGLDGALVGYLVSGFFVTVLYYPYFWINLAMTVALNNVARSESAALAACSHN